MPTRQRSSRITPEAVRSAVRKVRLAAGVTQAELAGRLRVPQSYVSKYERGERRLDLVELDAICGALGISVGAFVARLEGKKDGG